MRLTKLTTLAFMITDRVNVGQTEQVTAREVYTAIEDGTIFDWLANRGDLTFLEPVDKLELLIEWHDFYLIGLCPGRDGGWQDGWCVLLNYLLEGIQRRLGDPRYRLSEEMAVRLQ